MGSMLAYLLLALAVFMVAFNLFFFLTDQISFTDLLVTAGLREAEAVALGDLINDVDARSELEKAKEMLEKEKKEFETERIAFEEEKKLLDSESTQLVALKSEISNLKEDIENTLTEAEGEDLKKLAKLYSAMKAQKYSVRPPRHQKR